MAGAWHTQLTVEPFLLDGGSGQNADILSGVGGVELISKLTSNECHSSRFRMV